MHNQEPAIKIWQAPDDQNWRIRLTAQGRHIESRTVRNFASALDAAREMMDQHDQSQAPARIKLEGKIGGFQ